MRVVFDTNIYISALVIPGGKAEAAINRIIDGHDRLIVSKPIIDEVLDVLVRKFSRSTEEAAKAAVFISELARVVEPATQVSILADEPDNRILECAIAGDAKLVVTGDKAMLGLGQFEGIDISTLSAYLS